MRWQPLAWAVVVVVAILCERINAVDAAGDVTLLIQANSLRSHSANLDLVGLAARFALQQQYDAVTDADKALANEISALKEAHPPPEVVAALATFEKAFGLRHTKLDDLKLWRGALTGLERYVVVLLDELRRDHPDEPRVGEAHELVLAWQLASSDDHRALHDLQDFIARLKQAKAGDLMAKAVPHLETLVEARTKLSEIAKDELMTTPLTPASNQVFEAVVDVIAEHQRRSQRNRTALLGLAVLLTLATLWAADRR